MNMKLLPFILVLIISNTALAKKSLNISNLPADLQNEVIKRYPQVENDKISLETIDEVIRLIMTKGQYELVRVIDAGNSSYSIEYKKTKKISGLKFSGLKSVSETEARNLFNFRNGDVFDQNVIIEAGESLRQYYKTLGYQNTVIDIELPPDPQNEAMVTVVVKVTENNQTEISQLEFQTENSYLLRQLNKKFKSKEGTALTDSSLQSLQKDIREYLNNKQYIRSELIGPEIRYNSDESKAAISYKIEKPDAFTILFDGNKFETSRAIESAIDIDNFNTANPNIGAELANKVKNYYLSQGYAKAEVTSIESDGRAAFEKRISLNIEEGPQVKVQKYTVNGKYSRDADYYEAFLKKHSSELVSSGFYNKEDVESGFKNLILQLQNEGYLLAKVISSRTQYNKEKNKVTIVVNIDEGPLTQIDSINFNGNFAFTNDQVLKVSGLNKTGPLRLKEIETALTNIKNFYRENGYIEMNISNEHDDLVTYDETNTLAKLNFKIFEGPQVKAASIIIEGNNFTKDYVIEKEIELEKSQIVTPFKIEESVARLQRTGFFSSVEIKTLEEKTNVANRTVVVKVVERDPGAFTMGAGATSERTFTVRGYLGIAYRNLAGTGRGISARIEGNYNITQIKYLESKLTVGYLEPYLFNTRVRGRINLSRSKAVTDYGLKQVTEINQINYLAEKDFTSHIIGVMNLWGLATVRQTGIDESYTLPSTNIDIATTGPSIDFDYRDNPFNPTSGTFTRLNTEYSSPTLGSSRRIEYTRSTASFTHYLKLTDSPVVLANNIQGGYLKNLSTEIDGGVPYDLKGFILGGRSTVRGFEAGTSDVFPNKTDLGGDQFYLTTSAQMFLIKSELRFPIYGNFAGALFYDGGYVSIENLKLNDNYRDSVGIGFRYNTPVGPLNLEWAWKLDRKGEEAPNRFHLSIGTF